MKRKAFTPHQSPGQAMVIFALAIVLLVAMLGLALDGANAFGQLRRVGNVADAASMAATRLMIEQQQNGGDGGPINDLIDEYLTGRHDLPASGITWTAFYVGRLNPDVQIAPVEMGVDVPSDADGIQVNLSLTFPTYFMGVFGQDTLTVSSSGASVYGPLGTAVGQDLAPLGISVTALEILKREPHVKFDLEGEIASNLGMVYIDPSDPDQGMLPDELPGNVISQANIAHVSFRDVAGEPTTGSDCGSPSVVENLTYWWCQGSPNRLRINREMPAGSPDWGDLEAAISWRVDHRNLAVLPVYAESLHFEGATLVPYYQLVNFVAVELENISNRGVLRAHWIENYATAGAMIGDGSGVETGVWAINLVR